MKALVSVFFMALVMCCYLKSPNVIAQVKSDSSLDSVAEKSNLTTPNDDNMGEVLEPSSGGSSGGSISFGSNMSSFEFNLSVIILVFGFLVLVAEFILLRKMTSTPEQILRIFGITLIVVGAMMMIPAGFSPQTIAPAMGLLGTIAGYLLSSRSPTHQQDTSKEKN